MRNEFARVSYSDIPNASEYLFYPEIVFDSLYDSSKAVLVRNINMQGYCGYGDAAVWLYIKNPLYYARLAYHFLTTTPTVFQMSNPIMLEKGARIVAFRTQDPVDVYGEVSIIVDPDPPTATIPPLRAPPLPGSLPAYHPPAVSDYV